MASFTMLCYALDSKRSQPYNPPLPRIPDTRLPMAGDTVTYRLRGKLHTGRVLGVGTGAFDEPEFYLDSKVQVLRYAITGICEQRMVAA